MAKADLVKFRDLLSSDPEFREKFKKAAQVYSGEQDEKAVFDNLLLPLTKEYGLSATYEEFKSYIGTFAGDAESELSEDELSQVAGGKNSGYGLCFGVGGGDLFGTSEDDYYRLICGGVGLAWCPGVG